MSKHFQKSFDEMAAVEPKSGFRPESEGEWTALQQAHKEMGYAMFRSSGKPDAEAGALAHTLNGDIAATIKVAS